jgi:hypothetical protein
MRARFPGLIQNWERDYMSYVKHFEQILKEELKHIKVVIRIRGRKSKGRQYNGQIKRDKKDKQWYILWRYQKGNQKHMKNKNWSNTNTLKIWRELRCSGRVVVPAPQLERLTNRHTKVKRFLLYHLKRCDIDTFILWSFRIQMFRHFRHWF